MGVNETGQRSDEIEDKLLSLFHRLKASSSAGLDPDNLLQSLQPAGAGPIDNSFSGKRLKVRFLESVELEFSICLTEKAWERLWTFQDFASFVAERLVQAQSNLRLAESRLAREKRANQSLYVWLGLIFLLAIAAWWRNNSAIAAAVACMVGVAIVAAAAMHLAAVRHYRLLVGKISVGIQK